MATATAPDREGIERKIEQLESERGKQQAALTRAAQLLEELAEQRVAAQLDQDLGLGDRTKEIAATDKRAAELRSAQERATATLTEIEKRLDAIRRPLAEADMREVDTQLAALSPRARELYAEYRQHMAAVILTASKLVKTRGEIRRLQSRSDDLHRRWQTPMPTPAIVPPKPWLPSERMILRLDSVEAYSAWLNEKEQSTYRQFAD